MKTLLRPVLENSLTRRQQGLAASIGALLGCAVAFSLLLPLVH